jgi:hypothetical protein
MQLVIDGQDLTGNLYAKVVGMGGNATTFSIRFTSCSPEIETFLRGLLSATTESVPVSRAQVYQTSSVDSRTSV